VKRAIFTGIVILLTVFLFQPVSAGVSGYLSVTPSDGLIPKDGSASFMVSWPGTMQIKVQIYKVSNINYLLSDSGWIDGTEHTFDFTGFEIGSYYYMVYARTSSSEEGDILAEDTCVGWEQFYIQSDAPFKFEAGTVTVGSSWQSVSLSKSFSNPVVIVKSVEGCNDPSTAKDLCDYLTPRVRNVTSTSFEAILQAVPKNSSLSGPKTVSYIVVEAGRYNLGGFEIEAGSMNTSNFIMTKFRPRFGKEPVVITTITSFNGSDPATTRNKTQYITVLIGLIPIEIHITDFRDGFVSIIDEPGWNPFLEHKNEEVSYIAITPGIGVLDGKKVYVGKGEQVSHEAKTISFPGMFSGTPVLIADMQRMLGTDWSILRHASLTNSSAKLLVAEKEGGNHQKEPVGYILVGEEGAVSDLLAHFTAEPTRGAPPLSVNFDASGSVGAVSFDWDFGDGSNEIGETTDHSYTAVGEYAVKLTVKNNGNTATTEKIIAVVEEETDLVAVIEIDKEGCTNIPCTIDFNALGSTGMIESYEWDFDDGETGIGVQAEHAFESLGSFNVTLTVSDASGNSDTTSVIIGVGCTSNDDCLCGNGCYNRICLNPLLSINKGEDKVIGFRGEAKDIETIWTLTNVGNHKAVVQDFWLPGCEDYSCSIELINQGGQVIEPNTGEIPVIPCELIVPPEPSPTPAPSITPTPTNTPAVTPTPTVTPSPSPSPAGSFDLTVNIAGDGHGYVGFSNSELTGTHCCCSSGWCDVGGCVDFECSDSDYPNGVYMAIGVDDAPDSVFAGWSGDCSGTAQCNLVMDSDKTLTATFNSSAPTPTPEEFSFTGIRNVPNPLTSDTTSFEALGTGIEEINVKVFDLSSHLVFESGFVSGSTYQWNGKNNAGEQLANGSWFYKIIAKGGGHEEEIGTETVVILLKPAGEESETVFFQSKGNALENTLADSAKEEKGEAAFFAVPSSNDIEIYSPADGTTYTVHISNLEPELGETVTFTVDPDWIAAGNHRRIQWYYTPPGGSEYNVTHAAGTSKSYVLDEPGTHSFRIEPEWCTFFLISCWGWDSVSESFELDTVAPVAPTPAPTPVTPEPPEPVPPTDLTGYLTINPGESVKVLQRVRNVMPPSVMKELELGLVAGYTDKAGAGYKIIESHRDVNILLVNLASERFHLKYKLAEQSSCVGWNDVYGVTGEYVAPRVFFDWEFSSGETESVSINACEKSNGEFNYCDATQFFISLLKKLKKIDELSGSDTSSLKSFQAYLIKDNFSEDFRLDFDDYYNDAFFGAPSWYAGEWEKYVLDSDKLKFTTTQLPESGLYQVELEFAFDGADYEFFDAGEPSAVITVNLSRIHSVGVEAVNSPFYHLPFNGLVGTTRTDLDGEKERKDYGIGFVNQDGALIISNFGDAMVNTTAVTASGPFLTSKLDSFSELNLNERGNLLMVDLTGRKITFLPGQAMPVILGIESKANLAQAFYAPFKGDQLLGLANAPATYWTGVASSMQNCTDFIGNALNYNEGDKKAASFDSTCSVPLGRENAFGFKWSEAMNNGERVFYKTVFYSPIDEQMFLKPACSGVQDSVSVFASPFGLASDSGQTLALQQTGEEIDSFKKLAEGIASERVCMAAEGNKFVFFWNTEKLEESLDAAKEKIEEDWEFNWSNYECGGN